MSNYNIQIQYPGIQGATGANGTANAGGNNYSIQYNNAGLFSGTNLYWTYNSAHFTDICSFNFRYQTTSPYPWDAYYSSVFEIVDSYYGGTNSIVTGYTYNQTWDAYPAMSFQSGCYAVSNVGSYGGAWVFDGAAGGYGGYPSQFVISPCFYLPAFTWYTSNAPGAAGSEVPFVQAAAIAHDGGMYLSSATGGSLGIGTFNATEYYVNGVPVATGVLTVATLPAAAAGARSFVSDSTVVATGNFGATVVGSGLYTVPVWSDGSAWYIG